MSKAKNRKAGRPMSDEDRQEKSLVELVGQVNQFLRTDYGGRDKNRITADRLKEFLAGRPVTEELTVEFSFLEVNRQVKGIRTRQHPVTSELKRRGLLLSSAVGKKSVPFFEIAAHMASIAKLVLGR